MSVPMYAKGAFLLVLLVGFVAGLLLGIGVRDRQALAQGGEGYAISAYAWPTGRGDGYGVSGCYIVNNHTGELYQVHQYGGPKPIGKIP